MTALLTASELAAELRTTKPTVLSWHHAGKIPAAVSIGRIIRFDREQVLAALAANAAPSRLPDRTANTLAKKSIRKGGRS